MTTIESIFQRTDTPESADFAILDLAQKDEGQLLGWLYNHFDLGDIPWNPLYQGTELASNWSTGPILIELRDSQVFREALIERYQSDCLGMLISAPDVSLAAMADHLRSYPPAGRAAIRIPFLRSTFLRPPPYGFTA